MVRRSGPVLAEDRCAACRKLTYTFVPVTQRRLQPAQCEGSGRARSFPPPGLVEKNRYPEADGLLELTNSQLAGVNW